MTKLRATLALALTFASFAFAPAAWANKADAIDAMEAYLEFVDYAGGVIFAEQIPKYLIRPSGDATPP